MNKDRREPEYPTELESQIILRLPEEPAKMLREILQTGENLKNRLTIDIDNDMRNGEVRFDHWLMHGKIVDLPTIVESLKTIDNKSFYKTADICQMMICKEGPEQPPEEEPTKNKKKDPYKVDKKFLWPHGITPPTKNVRKRRFRKTLKKKYVEAPEIEKEVKRLLRADNEALSVSWEVLNEDDDQYSAMTKVEFLAPPPPSKPDKKSKAERNKKAPPPATITKPQEASNVVDIFGGAVSDSDPEDDHGTAEGADHPHRQSPYDGHVADNASVAGAAEKPQAKAPIAESSILTNPQPEPSTSKRSQSPEPVPSTSGLSKNTTLSSDDDGDSKDAMSMQIEQLRTELEELKQRRKRTQHEIAGMENLALRQRFQDTLHTLNQDIMYKEMEYQGMITLANSEDI